MACVTAASVCVPSDAAAQGRQAFAAAVIDLTRSLNGAHGDEGPAVLAAVEAMAGALATWDRELDTLEARAAVSAPPEAARLGAALGLAYAERGRIAEALDALERVSQAEPLDARPHFLRGLVLVGRDPTEAALAFRRAWELDRGDPVKAYWVVQSAHDAGTADDVAPALEVLSTTYRRLANERAPAQQRPFPDMALFQDDAAEVPVFPPDAYREGYAHLTARDYDSAVAALRSAAAADPLVADEALRSPPAVQGIVELRQGRPAAAIGHLERAAGLASGSSEIRRVLGIAYRTAGRIDESISSLEEAIRIDPRNERAHLELVSVLEDIGARARVQQALEAAVDVLPFSGSLRWMYAVLARGIDNEELMLRQLESVPVASMLAGRGQVWAAVGRLHLSLMHAPAAMRPFRDAVLVNPNNARAHLDLGELYRTEGLDGPALATFVAALLIAPTIVEAHTATGQIYLAEGRSEEAIVAFERAVALSPSHPDAQYGLARALQRSGQTDRAARHFEEFTRLARQRADDLRSNYELFGLKREAAIHDDEGRHEEAVSAWRAVVEREGTAENHQALGEALAAAGRIDQAILALERAAAMEGAAADVYRRLAELYAAEGLGEKSAQARAEYERRQAAAFRQRSAGN